MRTPQDIINRKEANQRYYKLEENKEQKRNYMRKYNTRSRNWGGMRQENEDIKRYHEEWAIKNGYRDNDLLHAKNTERFIKT